MLAFIPVCATAASHKVPDAEPASPGKGLTITVDPADHSAGRRVFGVVLRADTPSARVKGLQGFRALLPGEAAIFVFDPPQQVSFWMASLSYAIDIIYIGSEGIVNEVFADCQPESTEIFTSHGPVRWVIEVVGGSGVRPGDRVRIE